MVHTRKARTAATMQEQAPYTMVRVGPSCAYTSAHRQNSTAPPGAARTDTAHSHAGATASGSNTHPTTSVPAALNTTDATHRTACRPMLPKPIAAKAKTRNEAMSKTLMAVS